MRIPDNMDDLLGKDELKDILDEVIEAEEVLIIWTDGGDDIHYAANMLRQSRVNWLLDRVKIDILSEDT